jgi:hypothetical protein
MPRHRRTATWTGAALGAACALLLALQAHASPGELTEEFHHTYALAADGRIKLANINGDVHIAAWDQNEVKVDAVKFANSQQRLDQMKIEIEAESNSLSIETKYPHHNLTFNGGWNDPGGVEYTLTVPRNARLDEIELVNGAIDIRGVSGDVRASSVNGRLTAENLPGRLELSTVNGRLEARFQQLSSNSIDLSSVNDVVELTLPSDANARIEASTVSGGIDDDFGIHVERQRWVGHGLRAELGNGNTRIDITNVNGRIEIHRDNDGKSMSPVKDLGSSDNDDDDEI